MGSDASLRFCVFGAGSVGCYLGGRLQVAGASVTLIGRPRIGAELAEHGLHLSDYRGANLSVSAAEIGFSDSADGAGNTAGQAAGQADIVLVTVKTAATREAGATLAKHLKPGAVVISFQNGLHNGEWLSQALPQHAVLTGMVPFNVAAQGEGRFHQGSSGELGIQHDPALTATLMKAFERAGLPLQLHDDMRAVQWAKLLLNLNNPINALSDVPLREELSQRGYRRCLAAAQREALSLLRARGLQPARLTAVPAWLFPWVLELPDFLFKRLARTVLAIDPLARSSMWDDLQRGRSTEIDWINGEVVNLARSVGRQAPVNACLTGLVHVAEAEGGASWRARALWAEIRRSSA